MSNTNIEQIADILYHAKTNNIPCLPIRNLLETASIEKAYQVQAINIEKEISQGNHITGKKIGLTSKAVQKQLGVNEPDFGTLVNSMEVSPDENKLAFSHLMQPKAEAEWAFVLKKSITKEIKSIEELQNYIDYAVIAIEIVGSRIQNWDIQIVDTVADNASASHYVLSKEEIPLSHINFTDCQMQLFQNNKLTSEGTGKACMGNPLLAVQWLANKMVEMKTPLQKGELVLSGALGPMVNLKQGDQFKVVIDQFKPVELAIN
ncbi:2-keto-4-pentenoate hydratase [Psychroflexus salis]|uniref:2-keto-4-pentenoate hydratase n=1 Tax=Psychroflexus salis TaxID=1526574 RepID=A0A916ZN25_9FLAO|nr:fumarylacetoacetate hydrolase family protein [Psychroflexus salis]GGE05522.1 2-keto-4-pentenoate hydratase [Psychroflexus salis]